MVYLTRIEKFNAAHKLWVKTWSDEKNKSMFGKCANKNFHGHNYTLHVTVKGHLDPATGFVINAKDLSAIVKKEIVEELDHMNLNMDIPEFEGNIQPTCENLTLYIWRKLSTNLNNCTLHGIKLYETDSIYTEYYGE